jgi:hypothetical protein
MLLLVITFGVSKTFVAIRVETQMKFFHIIVRTQIFRLSFQDDMPVFEDVAVVGVAECHHGVLLSEEDADTFDFIEPHDNIENLLDQLWRQTHGGLIQQDHLGSRHQGPTDGGHLLFTA